MRPESGRKKSRSGSDPLATFAASNQTANAFLGPRPQPRGIASSTAPRALEAAHRPSEPFIVVNPTELAHDRGPAEQAASFTSATDGIDPGEEEHRCSCPGDVSTARNVTDTHFDTSSVSDALGQTGAVQIPGSASESSQLQNTG